MKDENFSEKRLIFFIILSVTLFFIIYQSFRDRDIKKTGIYTKCTVVNSEAHKGGIIITVRYSYHGGKYEYSLGSDLGKKAIGRQYFIQFKPENPKTIVFLPFVPRCI